MSSIRCLAGCLFAGCAILGAAMGAEPQLEYPQTRRVNQVDEYHGTKVADFYRWLEQDVRQSPEVAEWVAAENRVTFAYLESIPQREAIRRRLTELWDFERYSAPAKRGGRYFYLRNDGLQNQDVLWVVDSLDGEPRVLIDPNPLSKDGTVALAGVVPSDDGRHLAYCLSEAGSDWQVWRVMELPSGKVLEDELKWVKFGSASWSKDGAGFYYNRYPQPEPGAEFQALNLNQEIYYHRLGAPQADDALVFKRPDEPTWGFDGEVTEDGRYLLITVQKGTDEKYRVVVKDLDAADAAPVDLIDNFDHEWSFVGNEGTRLYFQTDLDAPRRRLVAIDLKDPHPDQPEEIIAQAEQTLLRVSFVGGRFLASYLRDVKPQVKVFAADGTLVREVEFPGIGSASGFGGRQADTETFYAFESFATPPSIYRYDIPTGESQILRQAKVAFDSGDYEVQQVFYPSKDGTRVPMFLAHKKGIPRDGSNPTLLYGYGGFNIPTTPRFSVAYLAWMEMGGVVAVANLRGGGEYGEAWHQSGKKLRKQNVFDDFIAAAEWLVAHKVTRPEKLAIQGGSNGGLLVGAAMTQRPDLFGACLPAVGVMDMLRFHRFTSGRLWVDDYGSSDDRDEFKALLAYSPYHNLKPGTAYPATLVTTADTDDRVVPGHSFKFAAALQHAQAGPAPVLIRIETRAGHGAGKPVSKRIDEVADQWAFLVRNLRIAVAADK